MSTAPDIIWLVTKSGFDDNGFPGLLPDLEHGFFTTREDVDAKVEALNLRRFTAYQKMVAAEAASYEAKLEKYNHYLAAAKAVADAGIDPLPYTVPAPKNRSQISFERWCDRKFYDFWSATELNAGTVTA